MTVLHATGLRLVETAVLCFSLGVVQSVPVRADEADKRPSTRFWSFEMELSNVFDSNILEDEEDLESYGLVVGGVLRGEKRAGSHLLRLSYNLNLRSYTATDRWDGEAHDLAVTFFEQLGPRLNAGVVGGYSLRTSTEDRALANLYNVWSQTEYRPNRWIRVGVHGALRWTRLEDTVRDERVRLIGAESGGRIGRTGIWEMGYRYEDNDAANIYRRFDGSRFWAGYGLRLGDRDTLDFEVERRRRHFRELTVRVDSGTVLRQELVWTPSLSWTHLFGSGRWLRLSYELRRRRSNDPRKDLEAHRFEVTVRVPVAGRSRLIGPERGGASSWPRPPNGAVVSESNILDLILLYSEHEDQHSPAGGTFTVGSHWKELLAVQGPPNTVSKRPVFDEELWFYGSSCVVLRNGAVTSWYDNGNLRALAPPESRPTPAAEAKPVAVSRREASLSAVAARNRRPAAESVDDRESADGSAAVEPQLVDESLAGTVKRLTKTEVVLKDGTRLPGILKRYDSGLAYIILFLDDRRTILATLPEDLVDKEATGKGTEF